MNTSTALVDLVGELTPLFGARLLTTPSLRASYAQSEGHHAGMTPGLVAQPRSIEDVQAIVAAASRCSVPIVACGANTSLEGNAAADASSLQLDLSMMDAIVEVAPDDMLCVVGPGVTREAVNVELKPHGLFFPVDPGANATLVGMIATRASGTTAVRYGTMRENVLALKVVLPDGSLISTGTRARKSASGYDLTHLFTGSEGTLGIIVEATLRVHPLPEAIFAAVWDFETLESAVRTVIGTIQLGVPIARMELLDEAAIRAVNAHSKLQLAERPTLFLEFHGSPTSVAENWAMVRLLGADLGGGEPVEAATTEARTVLWKARHAALPAARALVPGSVVWSSDICVPISELAEAIGNAQRDIRAAGLIAPILGHVGDGNFHVFFVLKPNDTAAWDAAAEVNRAMTIHALSVGGTCTGEHGIGLGKRDALLAEHGVGAVALMRALKHAIDPVGLLNPGKIFA